MRHFFETQEAIAAYIYDVGGYDRAINDIHNGRRFISTFDTHFLFEFLLLPALKGRPNLFETIVRRPNFTPRSIYNVFNRV